MRWSAEKRGTEDKMIRRLKGPPLGEWSGGAHRCWWNAGGWTAWWSPPGRVPGTLGGLTTGGAPKCRTDEWVWGRPVSLHRHRHRQLAQPHQNQ